MKKIISVIAIICVFIFIGSSMPVQALEVEVSGNYAALYNINDGSIIYEKNADIKTPIASLTKMMTAIVALENIEDLDKKVTIKSADFIGTAGYSKAGFKVGDEVTFLDLLYGVLLPSGAEAVNAIVNNTLGVEFINEMNKTAQRIGLSNTLFSNAIGKDSDTNYSTAKDMVKLLEYTLKNETFKKIFTTREYTTTNNVLLKSTLDYYGRGIDTSKILGAKSGFTGGAGRCLASISSINGVNYLFVVINSSADSYFSAINDTLAVYNYYGDNYSYQVILDEQKNIKTIPVRWSREKEYDIHANHIKKMYLKNGTVDDLRYVYEGVEEIKIHTKENTKLGVLKIYDNEELIYQTDLFLLEDIKFYHPVIFSIIVGIIIIAITLLIVIKRRKRARRELAKL